MSAQFPNVNGMTIKMLVTFQALFTLLYVEKFENTTVTGYFEFCVWEKFGQENQMIMEKSWISESSFFKMFSDLTEIQSRRFSNSSGLKCVFEKLRFCDG